MVPIPVPKKEEVIQSVPVSVPKKYPELEHGTYLAKRK